MPEMVRTRHAVTVSLHRFVLVLAIPSFLSIYLNLEEFVVGRESSKSLTFWGVRDWLLENQQKDRSGPRDTITVTY